MQTKWKIDGIGHHHFLAPRALMPKIRDAIPSTTFFLFRQNPKTGEREGPLGTGCFILRSPNLTGTPHIYAVTNWHVAMDAGASIIRVNVADDRKSRIIDFNPEDWRFPQDGDDLAAIDVTDHIDHLKDRVVGLYEDMFVTEEVIKEFSIGLGEDTFMCGLFLSHYGGDRNVPVVRFGNLSMLASSDAPVELETGASLPSHLVDTRSRGGFSGSPVFVYRTGASSDLANLPYGWIRGAWPPIFQHHRDTTHEPTGHPDRFWGLLGIHCGQFWDVVEARKARPGERLGDPIKEGDRLKVQSGMTIVIPAWRVSKLLDAEDFEMARRKREDAELKRAENRPRGEVASPPASDANPKHREDFTRLVSAAARKREQED